MDVEWSKSKCSNSDFLRLVEEGLLQSKEVVSCVNLDLTLCPMKNVEELVLFQHFMERGLALPASEFLHGMLHFYGIQIHHLTPNSIVHISIFVHLCEAFLCVWPHWDLFHYIFHLKLQPDAKSTRRIWGCCFQLKQGKNPSTLTMIPRVVCPGGENVGSM